MIRVLPQRETMLRVRLHCVSVFVCDERSTDVRAGNPSMRRVYPPTGEASKHENAQGLYALAGYSSQCLLEKVAKVRGQRLHSLE